MNMAVKGKQKITKQFLKDYSLLLEEIEGEQERLDMMNTNIPGFTAGSRDGMPRSSNDPDKIGLQLSIKADLEARLAALIQEEKCKRDLIEQALISKVDLPQERQVVRLHYIDLKTWKEVQSKIFGKRKDYYDNEDKYQRLIFRMHGNALTKLTREEIRNASNTNTIK